MSNCSSYNDFLGEAIAETYRTNRLKKPKTTGKLHKAKKALDVSIQKESEATGKPVEDIAMGYVDRNSGIIQKYILSRGEIPVENDTAGLANQAYSLRQKEISDVANALGSDEATAEAYMDEAENNAVEINSAEADSFLGPLFAAIGKAVKGTGQPQIDPATGLPKQKGSFWRTLGSIGSLLGSPPQYGMQAGVYGGNNLLNSIANGQGGGLLQGAFNGVVAQQRRQQINRMLPGIIIGVIALVVIVVLIAKKK